MLLAACSVCKALREQELPKRYVLICEFRFSIAVLAPNQYYQGRCELWYNQHATELFELPETVRQGFCHELALLGEAMYNVLSPRKLNYEILGNTVPHLHCHIVPRYPGDPLSKRPIWENPKYKAVERQHCMSRRDKLDLAARIATEIQDLQRKSR